MNNKIKFFIILLCFPFIGRTQNWWNSYLFFKSDVYRQTDKLSTKSLNLFENHPQKAIKLYLKVRPKLKENVLYLGMLPELAFQYANKKVNKEIAFKDILNDSLDCMICCIDSLHNYCPTYHINKKKSDSIYKLKLQKEISSICYIRSKDDQYPIYKSLFSDDQYLRKKLGKIYHFDGPPNKNVQHLLMKMVVSDSLRYIQLEQHIKKHGFPQKMYNQFIFAFLVHHFTFPIKTSDLLFYGKLCQQGISTWYGFEYYITNTVSNLMPAQKMFIPAQALTKNPEEYSQAIRLLIQRVFLNKNDLSPINSDDYNICIDYPEKIKDNKILSKMGFKMRQTKNKIGIEIEKIR